SSEFATRVGDPIPYRIDLPRGAETSGEDETFIAATHNLLVAVTAVDLLEGRELPPWLTEAEARRMATDMYLRSDTAMFVLMRRMGISRGDARTRNVVRELRSLNGQRAG